jgi:ferredoxin
LWAAPRGAEWAWKLPSFSPHVALATLIGTRTLHMALGLGLLIGLIALFYRRWFCRWVCPTGTCVDATSRLGRRCGRRPPRLPAVGQWVVLVTLGGACLGYPLLLWLDPLAIFSAPFTWAEHRTEAPVYWSAAILPFLLLISVIFPHAWCQRLCPLGALQELLFRPVAALRRGRTASDDDALAAEKLLVTGRRALLFGALGLIGASFVRRQRAASAARPLRPPGACDEQQFTGLCIRCGNCTRACPAQIIQPDTGQETLVGWLASIARSDDVPATIADAIAPLSGWQAPIVRFDTDYCREDCTRCTDACPSGALQPVALADKQQTRIGFPRVDMDICLLGDGRDCFICRAHCPFEAISMRFDEEIYALTPQVDPDRCPGCGACQVACPTQPDKAIAVEPLPVSSGPAERADAQAK